MPKKLTKHQRQYRKRKKDSSRDFRPVRKEGAADGVRVTRRRLKVWVSEEAYQRLCELASVAGICNWEMLTRIILKSLPGYASFSDSDSPLQRYVWPDALIHPKELTIRYKGSKGDRQISYDITSTAWKKLECHKTASRLSKARIVQALILNYKPLTPEQLERQRIYRLSYAQEQQEWRASQSKEQSDGRRRFFDLGNGHFEHVNGIPMEYWDEAELDEYDELHRRYIARQLERLRLEGLEDSDEYRTWQKKQMQWSV